MTGQNMKRAGYFGVVILFCLFPFFSSLYSISLLSEILIMSIFALSLNILVGYTGLVSLGHAAFFGVGAYTASIVAIHLSSNVWFSLFAGFVSSLIIAAIIGFFCNKVTGFYFLMLTLAFSQMIYAIVHKWTGLLGGSNGLSGIPKPVLFEGQPLSDPISLYFFVLCVFLVVFFALRRFLASPLGQIFVGIRENETRMRAAGYNTTFYKNLAFVIAGGVGGIAGCLFSYFNGFVSPKDVYWTMSGEVLIMVLIGGAGTLLGPVFGAAFIVILATIVSSYTDLWMLIIGITFILFVIFAPKGIAGLEVLWKNTRPAKMGGAKTVAQGAEIISQENSSL